MSEIQYNQTSLLHKIYNIAFDNNDSVCSYEVVFSENTSVASLAAGQVADVSYSTTSLNSPGFITLCCVHPLQETRIQRMIA